MFNLSIYLSIYLSTYLFLSHRFTLDRFTEELTGWDEDGADNEQCHGPFVVEFEREIVNANLADAQEDFCGSFGDSNCRRHLDR